MSIQVSGKQIDVGEALTENVETRLGEIVGKYAVTLVSAQVTFSRDRHMFVSDLTAHLSTGLTGKAQGRAGDVYDCFEAALEKLDKQMRRYKRRLKDHHKDRQDPIEVMAAPSYVIDRAEEQADEPDSLQPVIIAEMETPVKSLSVGEAVMQMELDSAPFLVFRNLSHGGVNVVYQREDGNVGWIDPRNLR